MGAAVGFTLDDEEEGIVGGVVDDEEVEVERGVAEFGKGRRVGVA